MKKLRQGSIWANRIWQFEQSHIHFSAHQKRFSNYWAMWNYQVYLNHALARNDTTALSSKKIKQKRGQSEHPFSKSPPSTKYWYCSEPLRLDEHQFNISSILITSSKEGSPHADSKVDSKCSEQQPLYRSTKWTLEYAYEQAHWYDVYQLNGVTCTRVKNPA